MEKKILEDIKINKEKKVIPSIQEGPILSQNGEIKYFNNYQGNIKEDKVDEYFKSRSSKPRLQRSPQEKEKKRIISRPTMFILFICLIGGIIYLGGNIFKKANIEITSKHQSISYNNKLFNSSKADNNDVDFEIMIVSDKKSKNFTLTEPKEVSIKATGVITFYNEFSTTPQKLLVGTFLTDSAGKTYKTTETVVIPGYKFDKNKKIISGQMDVKIISFLSGEAYNGSPQNFYVTSFKGTTKYNKIYAKLKNPLTGGISGTAFFLTDSDKEKVKILAESTFKNDLFEKVKALVPPGYILYPQAMTFIYNIEDSAMSKTPDTTVEINGTLSVVLLKEQSLIENIIKISLPGVSEGELKEIKILNLDNFLFNFANKDQLITKDMGTISFSLTGNGDVLWIPDIEILKTKLAGIHKDQVLNIFRQDPGISSALVKLFPPWQKYIPSDISKINIILK